jgi:hypothetical protein
MSVSKFGVAVLAAAAAGALAVGGAATAAPLAGTPTAAAAFSNDDQRDLGASDDTPVTGDELAKVTAAVQGKDASVTVSSVRKDPDGSYDVFGTKAGALVAFEVSADLQTVTEETGHGRGGGASDDTPVTGDELAKVTAAVQGKDASVTVSSVRKDPDGSYDVFGTKAGALVAYEVSADLQTITENTGHGGGHR